MINEAEKRKERSIDILKKQNIPYMEGLPMIETASEIEITRTADEIAKRAIACLVTIQVACDMSNNTEDIEKSIEYMLELLKTYGVQDCLTENEKMFFTGKPDEQDTVNMIWKYEAYWVLLWALGIVDQLNPPSGICDCDFAIKSVSECESYQEFMKKVDLKSIEKILDEADLIFRYNWACVDARINGKATPENLNSSVVLERHKALNWLIAVDYDEKDENWDDWDNVSTNT